MSHRLDNFELQGVVVQGPNGVVYRGWDHNLGIPVAIQEYLPMHLAWRKADGHVAPLAVNVIEAFARGRQAFVNEARVLARCDHPSLLRVRQLLHSNGTSYKVMPWYEGQPLLDVRHDIETPPDEPALRALLSDLLGALEAYHRVGGVHGNVNPSQILLLNDDRALLLGPGAARRDPSTAAVEPLMQEQSAGFLAPEQLTPQDDSQTGPWTDFFALARVLRFCISGMLPASDAPAPEPAAVMVDKLYFDAPGVRYSANFLAALDAATASAIDERPQTAAEFCDWLDHGPRRGSSSPKPASIEALSLLVSERAPLHADTSAPDVQLPSKQLQSMHLPEGPKPDIPVAAVPMPDIPLPDTSPATDRLAPEMVHPAAHVAASSTPPATGPATGRATGPATALTAAAAKQEEKADAETVALIQRVIESIPKPGEQAPNPPSPEPAWQADRLPYLPDLPPPSAMARDRSHRGLWLLVIVLVLSLGGYAAWMQQQQLASPAQTSVAAATPPVKALPEIVEEKDAGPPTASSLDASAAAPAAAASAAVVADASEARAGLAPSSPPAQAASVPPPELPETSVVEIPATPKVVEVQAAQSPAQRVGQRPAQSSAQDPAQVPTQSTAHVPAPASPDNPRAACGDRTEFSLYRCMQLQCAKAAWAQHAQCARLKANDRVD